MESDERSEGEGKTATVARATELEKPAIRPNSETWKMVVSVRTIWLLPTACCWWWDGDRRAGSRSRM